jgi:hypothetical protein
MLLIGVPPPTPIYSKASKVRGHHDYLRLCGTRRELMLKVLEKLLGNSCVAPLKVYGTRVEPLKVQL